MAAWRTSRIAAVLLLCASSVPSGAVAQDDDSDPIVDVAEDTRDPVVRAREEFAAGVACVAQAETRCALEHFRAALALHDAPTIRYNLASALFELEQYPEAARLLESVIGDEETSDEIRGHATTLQNELLEAAGVYEITVAGTSEPVDVQVDDDTLPASQRHVPVAPGVHTVRALRDGATVAELEVTAESGQTAPVELVVAPTAEEAAAAAALEEDPGDGTVELWEDWPFWAIVGGGVATILIIIIAAVVASENAGTQEPVIGDYDPGLIRW